MEAVKAKELAKAFVRGFYLQGNLYGLINADTTDPNLIGFATQSAQYARGREAVLHILQQEYALIAPCRLFRARFHVHLAPREFSVTCLLVLRTAQSSSMILHRLILMYRLADEGTPVLRGIHLTRSYHHESTYRLVCSRILSTIVARDRAAIPSTAEALVPMFTQSAFITYRMTGNRFLLTEYSDDLWRMLGYSSEAHFKKAVGVNLMTLLDKAERKAVQTSIARQLEQRDVYQVEYSIRHAEGRLLHIIEYGGHSLFHDDKNVYHAVLLDITPLQEASDALMYQVSYDSLTGLFNQSTFCQRVQELLDANLDESFELMALDITRFKIINDLFGEDTGDSILRYLADFFKETHLAKSVFGRLHSDIFLLFYPAEKNNRERFIKTLKVLASSFTLGYRVTVRFGVYAVGDQRRPESRLPVTTMIDRAVLALSKAKRSGLLDCAEYNETMRHKILTEQSVVNEMNDALANRDFVIYLQPKYDASTERIVGAEALVRWLHPKQGMIPPGDFIPIFEHNGFIFQLDQYIWEETCRLLRRWLDEGKNPPPISVNVSRVDFYSPQLVAILSTLVKKYSLPPSLLELELTESAYTENPQQIIAVTKKLQNVGFKILMDDFGSGYSSLNMLKDLPVDILKIDLKFLAQEGTTGRGGNILNSIVRMAKWMHMPVIVEGVETRDQANFLRAIGCEYIQGYYFSKPMPVADYEELMARMETDSAPAGTTSSPWPDIRDFDELFDPGAKLDHILNGLVGGIALYEFANGRLEGLRANEKFFRLLHSTPSDLMNNSRHVLDFIVDEDRPRLLDAIEHARKYRRSTECIVRRRILDGQTLWLRARCSIILDSKERVLLFISWDDVSEQYALPIELHQLIDTIPCGFMIGEMENDTVTVSFINRRLCEMYDLSPDAVLKRRVPSLDDLIGKELSDLFLPHIHAAAGHSGPYTVEYPRQGKDDTLRRFRAVLQAVRRQDGALTIYATVYDITRAPSDPTARKVTDPPRD